MSGQIHFYAYELARCDNCGKPATKEIRGPRNTRYGYACDRCASKRLKDLDRSHNERSDERRPA